MKTDYFTLLNLTPTFDLDQKALETAYFAQQRLTHPDRFVKKSAEERQQALLRSVEANAAYETLKKPLSRAQYLLHLQGITVGTEADTVKPSTPLLMETMEWREAIGEAANNAELNKLDDTLDHLHMKSLDQLSIQYANQQWQPMTQETLRLGYIIRAQEEIARRRKTNLRQAT